MKLYLKTKIDWHTSLDSRVSHICESSKKFLIYVLYPVGFTLDESNEDFPKIKAEIYFAIDPLEVMNSWKCKIKT